MIFKYCAINSSSREQRESEIFWLNEKKRREIICRFWKNRPEQRYILMLSSSSSSGILLFLSTMVIETCKIDRPVETGVKRVDVEMEENDECGGRERRHSTFERYTKGRRTLLCGSRNGDCIFWKHELWESVRGKIVVRWVEEKFFPRYAYLLALSTFRLLTLARTIEYP